MRVWPLETSPGWDLPSASKRPELGASLWISDHIHESNDRLVERTRLISNPNWLRRSPRYPGKIVASI
jgi:hypothetical protein